MAAVLKRWGGVVVSAAVLVAGCDNAQNAADRQVREELAKARLKAMEGGDAGTKAAHGILQNAYNSAASPGVRASAKAELAQAELDAAASLIQKIDESELILARIVSEVMQLGGQIHAGSTAVTGYRQQNPRPTREAIDAKIAQAQGGPDKPTWFTSGTSVIPTLSAARQEVTRIEAELTQKREQVSTFGQQRTRSLDEAEQAAAQADQLKGDQSLASFKRSADLRKQAGEISIRVDLLGSEISRLEKGLAVAKSQQTAASDAIAQLQDQARTLDQGWSEMEKQISAQQQISVRVLGSAAPATDPPSATAGGTITQKAAEADRIARDIRQLREQAQLDLTNSAQHFGEAADAAADLQRQIGQMNPAQKAAWANMDKQMDPARFRVRKASALQMLAGLHASDTTSLAWRIAMRDSLQSAINASGLRTSADLLGAGLDQALQAALTGADAAYKEADELFDQAATAAREPSVQNNAYVSGALNSYGWAQIARQQRDQKAADDRIAIAKQRRNSAGERNVQLPPMPVELGQYVRAEAPAPSGLEAPAPSDAAPAPETPAPSAPAPQ